MPIKPSSVKILGITYTIEYVDNPAKVDIYKRESMWGQTDYWTRSIRVYEKALSDEDVFSTVLHEVLHGIAVAFKLNVFGASENHDELDLLALALTDVLFRNGWIKRDLCDSQ